MSEDNTTPAPEASRPRGRPRGSVVRGREQSHEPVREPTGRAARIPLGSHRQKLQSNARPGFVRRWVNDVGARLQYAQQAGYTFVAKSGTNATTTDLGEAVSQIGGTKEGGQHYRTYLMEIPDEWYREDQAAKNERVNALESQILRGKDEKGGPGEDGRYLRVGAKRIGL